MAERRQDGSIRIALIGKTGAGKSALGNTLLGRVEFTSMPCSESVTLESMMGQTELESGKILCVVDTPGIMDTENRDVVHEVTKAIAYLSPGPHAFLLVLQPNRATKEEISSLQELQNLFGDDSFYKNTIIIMVRRNEIVNPDGSHMDIHKFIAERTCKEVKSLYEMCGKRIIAVDNFESDKSKKEDYRNQILVMIDEFSEYYSHKYFEMVVKYNELYESIKKMKDTHELQREIDMKRMEELITVLQNQIKELNSKRCVIS